MLNVLIVNTSECTGGAAIAANRLKNALNEEGARVRMLVRDKSSDDTTVIRLPHRLLQKARFLYERLCIFFHLRLSRKHLFEIDIANTGTDITTMPEFAAADIIHLHWINQGMLSLRDIRKILDSGKPVVWTLHDMWPAMGLCHYPVDCQRFLHGCDFCPLLPHGGSVADLSARVWQRKKKLLENHTVHFVACSKWLAGVASQSNITEGQHFDVVPNAIDTSVFHHKDRDMARREVGLTTTKRIILFVSQRVTNKLKGMEFFIRAMEKMIADHPDMAENTAIAILGGHADEVKSRLPLETFALGYVGSQQLIVDVYNSADVFVTPSLSDNLPNTIMESMACGTPCVGFNVGGIPEEIDHMVNGYVAEYKNHADLARGVCWVLNEADHDILSQNAMRKVAECYSPSAVARKYMDVYRAAMQKQ